MSAGGARRSCLQWYRSDTENLIDVSLLLVATTVVGLVLGSDWSYGDIPNNACLSTVTLGVLSSVRPSPHPNRLLPSCASRLGILPPGPELRVGVRGDGAEQPGKLFPPLNAPTLARC